MRYYLVQAEPTARQLDAIKARFIHRRMSGMPGHVVGFDETAHATPRWLTAADVQILNVPGELARCHNCGALIEETT